MITRGIRPKSALCWRRVEPRLLRAPCLILALAVWAELFNCDVLGQLGQRMSGDLDDQPREDEFGNVAFVTTYM